MFAFLGSFVFRHRRAVLLVWMVVFVAGLFLAPQAGTVLKAGGFDEKRTEASRTQQLMEAEFGTGGSTFVLIFSHPTWRADSVEFLSAQQEALAGLQSLASLNRIISYQTTKAPQLISADGHSSLVFVSLTLGLDEAIEIVPQIRELVRSPELEVQLTGSPPIYRDILKTSEEDLRRAETFSLPLALLVLLLVFGGLVAAGAPLISGGAAVISTLAVMYLLAQRTDMSIFALNMATMLGLGLGIDYALLMVNRFREELQTKPVGQAISVTMATAGRAIFFSGLITMVGLTGLLGFDFVTLRSLGIGGALVVLFSVLAALTLLPALLGLVGHRIDALTIHRFSRDGGFWHRLATGVMRHPGLVFVSVLALLLLLGTPFLRVKLGVADASLLPETVPSRQAYDTMVEKFGPGEASPILVTAQASDAILSSTSIGTLYDMSRQIGAMPGVKRMESIVNLDPRLNRQAYLRMYANPAGLPPEVRQAMADLSTEKVAVLRVYSDYSATSDQGKELVRQIRALRPQGLSLLVGGTTAFMIDTVDLLYTDFPRALVFVVVIIYLVLLVVFRSVVLPLKAVLMNALSLTASYGALVFIFQEGNFSSLLGFSSSGFVEAELPILLFCIVFGLSMDYEVFLLSRVKEEYDRTGDNTGSVAAGLERTGRIITSAALILVVVGGSFATANIVFIKTVGVGIAIAVALDATVVRALLVPATMRLLGDWNWWAPAWLKRVLPEQKLE